MAPHGGTISGVGRFSRSGSGGAGGGRWSPPLGGESRAMSGGSMPPRGMGPGFMSRRTGPLGHATGGHGLGGGWPFPSPGVWAREEGLFVWGCPAGPSCQTAWRRGALERLGPDSRWCASPACLSEEVGGYCCFHLTSLRVGKRALTSSGSGENWRVDGGETHPDSGGRLSSRSLRLPGTRGLRG